MPSLTAPLVAEGALVPVLIGVSAASVQALRAGLHPIPQPVAVNALLDTGAEITGIDTSIVQQLGLPSSGPILANLPAHGGLTIGHLHRAGLTVVHPSGSPRDN